MKFGEVKERILKEYSWAGESVGSSQLFMISSGVSILDNNESDNSKDRLLGTQSELELGQFSMALFPIVTFMLLFLCTYSCNLS